MLNLAISLQGVGAMADRMRARRHTRRVGRRAVAGVVSVTVLGLLAVPAAGASGERTASAGDGRLVRRPYIVTLADGGAAHTTVAAAAPVTHRFSHALNGFSARLSPVEVAALRADPNVVAVERDGVVHAAAQTVPWGVQRIGGRSSSAVSGDGRGAVNVDVAVLDTGIDLAHPDLNVVGGRNCSSGTGYGDRNGHGTHVAGIAAARDNTRGVVGVAPGARLHSVRVLDSAGGGMFSDIICGLDWVTANASRIEVANLSLSGKGRSTSCAEDAFHRAVCRAVAAGVTVVAAAGNGGTNAAYAVPATYDQVLAVSALTRAGGFASFSNYGKDVDLIAPGAGILSTMRGNRYGTLSGTSAAAPHVAGAAALVMARRPSATPSQVRSALLAAGSLNWNAAADPDTTKEKLVGVGSL